MVNPIPLERGLGSSAAATVGGPGRRDALLGEALSPGDRAPARDEDRGPPGQRRARRSSVGLTSASIALDDRVESIRLDSRRPTRGPRRIPDRRLKTSEMRRVLPDSVPRADAIANLARVAVGVAGLASGRSDVLALLTQDRLHEPYRAAAYPELPHLVEAARAAGAIGACLAGSGSTVIAFTDTLSGVARIESAFRAGAADTDLPGRVEVVAPRNAGAKVLAEH